MSFNPQIPDLQAVAVGAGIRTPLGVVLSPGSRVAAYVRSGGAPDGCAPEIAQLLVTTLDAGLKRCRSGMNDVVVVMPGHAENVTATACRLAELVTGTRILGFGVGSNRPTFTFTATGSSWVLDDANVVISGLKLNMYSAAIAKGINVTAADALITDCEIEVGNATSAAVIMLEVGTAAHRFRFLNNIVRGTTDNAMTNCIKLVGATPAADVEIAHNRFYASANVTNGFVNVTVGCLRLDIHHNRMYSTTTNAVNCILLADAPSSGYITDNRFAGVVSGTSTDGGISFGSSTLVVASENYNVDEVKKSGLLTPVAGT